MEEDDRKVSAEVTTSAVMHNDTSDNEDDGDHESDRSKGPLRKRKYAPSPPKRFKSSYICFSMAMHEKIKAEMSGDHNKNKISEVSKYMAEKWRNLDEKERAKWDEVARKDRERYEAELALFPGPMPKPKQRPKKDPSAPKRPMSAFLAFSQKYRGTVRQNDPTVHNRDVSKKLSEMWKELPENVKKKYIEQESKEREVYKAKMAEWKKEQAEVRERMKEERKANKKRRRREKAKEKREAEKETRRNEEEMMMQLRAAETEYYVDRAKESGDPSELRKISGMGFLAAAAEAASKVDGSPTSTNEPTSESAAVDAGHEPNNPSSNAGHEPGHFGVAAVAAVNNQAPAASPDQVMSARNGLAAESFHGSSGSVEGYSMEGEVQRALAAAGTTQAIPTMLQAQHHQTSPATALLRAYSRPGAPAVGGSAIPDAPIATAADPVSQLASSAQLHPHISPSALSLHLGAHGTQGQEGSLGAVNPHAPPSALSNQQYLQQLLAEEDLVREQLALCRAQEAAALAQMRAQIQERTRMRLEAERERILLSLRAHSELPVVPGALGVLTGLHGSLAYPSTAATMYLDPGLSTSRAPYASAITQGLEAVPSHANHGEALTGNMLLELMEARRQETALAALVRGGRVADIAGGALLVAPQDLSVQPTQHILPTGATPLEVPSTSLTPAGAVQAPPAAPPQAVAPQDPSAAPPAEVATQVPAVEETPAQKTS